MLVKCDTTAIRRIGQSAGRRMWSAPPHPRERNRSENILTEMESANGERRAEDGDDKCG
jgi:hypothetical protein